MSNAQALNDLSNPYIIRANAYVESFIKIDPSDLDALKTLVHQMTQWSSSISDEDCLPGVRLRIDYCVCSYYYEIGDFVSAYCQYRAALQRVYGPQDNLYLAKLFRLINWMNYIKGALSNALDAGRKALEYAVASKNTEERIQALMFLGITYSLKPDRKKQLAYFDEALELAKEHHLDKLLRILYNNIAYTYYLLEDYAACAKCISEAECLYGADDIDLHRIALMLTKVSLLHHQGSLQEASILLARVEHHPRLKQDKAVYMDWELEMARNYRLNGNLQMATLQLKNALEVAKTYELSAYQLMLLDALSACAMAQNGHEEAHSYQAAKTAVLEHMNREKDAYQTMLNEPLGTCSVVR